MDERTIDELSNARQLSAELRGIFLHKLEVLIATAQAYRTDESPIAGKQLADLIASIEQAAEEAGTDRLITILPLLVELVADSLVELIAENNRRILSALAGE